LERDREGKEPGTKLISTTAFLWQRNLHGSKIGVAGAASVTMVFFDEEEAITIIYILLTFVSLSSNGDQGQTKDGKYAGNRRKHLRCLYLARYYLY
jgi:hypothetical protein